MDIEQASPYAACRLCPRLCGVNRQDPAGPLGFCREPAQPALAFAGIHRGEEPPIAGFGGSGTIFIRGCSLGCLYCQNHQVSRGGLGRPVEGREFSRICLALQEKNAENINLVTGSHAAPALGAYIAQARREGLRIPVVWNSSAYEDPEGLAPIKDELDIYLPDLKTLDRELAARYFGAPDYPDQAVRAILWMMDERPLRYDLGHLVSGVIIRHLLIPGHLAQTREVLLWYAEHCRDRALLSLMTQYTPVYAPSSGSDAAEIPDRYVDEGEYGALMLMLEELGIEEGYCQELVTGSDWLPDFKLPNPFSSELSVPVWHWREGFIS
ncbi:MAG: radical SAM protein [Treponema sp.]|nr:radical SAM protein [Treponema sp.]